MRIAISAETDEGLSSQVGHPMGRSPYFAFVDVEGDDIGEIRVIPNPHLVHHERGAVAAFIEAQGAQVMISGGMGRHAHERFQARGIARATRASGTIEQAVRDYLAGRLPDDDACQGGGHEHPHDHEHNHHHVADHPAGGRQEGGPDHST